MKKILYGASVRGDDHYKRGQVCQDANSYQEVNFDDEVPVLAIADGHGGAPYARSALGAKIATVVAKREMEDFILSHKEVLDRISSINQLVEQDRGELEDVDSLKSIRQNLVTKLEEEFAKVKENIWDKWKRQVDKDLEEKPCTVISATLTQITSITNPALTKERLFSGYAKVSDDALLLINNDLLERDVNAVKRNPRNLYGATLLCVGVYKDHYFFIQIGDGDIVVVDSSDKAWFPFNEDEELVGSVTYSLCQGNATAYFKEKYVFSDLRMVMLSSDGVLNGVGDREEIEKIAKGLYENVVQEPQTLIADLPHLLRNCSSSSGDDCTIGFIASNVSDATYDAFYGIPGNECEESAEKEEEDEELKERESELEKLYKPKFEPYKFNFPEAEKVEKVNGLPKFNEISKKLFTESFKKQDYLSLIDAKKKTSKFANFIQSYFTKGFDKIEQELNEKMLKEYNEKLDAYLSENPLMLIKFGQTNVGLKDRTLDVYEKEEIYGIVKSVDDNKIEFERVSKENYQRLTMMMGMIGSPFSFDGSIKINSEYSLKISKNKLSLTKTKE
ncbi:MAG: protein phosphatase 2C domain-containing protein [Clostridiales bacterium]|nr:protein phosphatase 2C domain-containing protein [Clostridiales bacterium]